MNIFGAKYSAFLKSAWPLILLLAITKLLIHFFTFNNFELHRDAYLYYAQSEHLAWGFIAVPPSTAVFGKIATLIFGNTTFALRFFPALIGALNVVIIGLSVKQLGGKKLAVILAGLAYILSPAYLHVNALYQPVSFNHFYWLLSGYLILLMVKYNNPKIWIWIGIVFGLGFLNKYSIVFFYAAFAIALLFSKQRPLYWSKYLLMGMGLGFVIILPNLWWQFQHNWPVMMHMAELRETQLVHVDKTGFLIDQLIMNAHALLFWLGALFIMLFYRKEKQYRIFGYIFLFVIVLLLVGSGKAYYSLGLYPLMFAFGAYYFDKYILKFQGVIAIVLILSMFSALYFSLSMDGVPLSTFEKSINPGAFRWEDGKMYDLPQDMADMTGWREIGETVTDIYLGLGTENADNCDIYCDHYGEAGAVMFWGKDAGVPQPISFNASFVFWSPESLTKDYMIWVNEGKGEDPENYLSQFFESCQLKTTINNPYFRENGTRIYLCKFPTSEAKVFYRERMSALKSEYVRD